MAGNKNSGRKAAGPDFSGRVRAAFHRTLQEAVDNHKLDELLLAQVLEDPLGAMNKMAPYAPKQVDMTLEDKTPVDTTALSPALLKEMFEERLNRESEGNDQRVH